jgi:hypothetical protein
VKAIIGKKTSGLASRQLVVWCQSIHTNDIIDINGGVGIDVVDSELVSRLMTVATGRTVFVLRLLWNPLFSNSNTVQRASDVVI